MAKAPKKPLTKTELIAHLALKTDVPKTKVKEILSVLTETAYKQAKIGFTIPGIGKLIVVKRKARMGRNPRTGEAIQIPAKRVVKFRVSKVCKDAILGG